MAGIYIHIPFCRQACHYCDFHFSTNRSLQPELVDLIGKELILQKDYLQGEAVHTLYFGGGTPSLLDTAQLETLLAVTAANYALDPEAEITLEANPDDLTGTLPDRFRRAGINRLSIGIQSFDDKILNFLNRCHGSQMAIDSFRRSREAGFDNISVDLIYAIPGVSAMEWEQSIRTAIDLDPEHISAYTLTVEPKTVFGHLASKGKFAEVGEDIAASQMELLIDLLAAAGYEQYEISNFSKPGFQSRHNTSYWRQEIYLGVGPGAHSYNGVSRQFNISNNYPYVESLRSGHVPFRLEMLDKSEQINEYLLTSLRMTTGCDLQALKTKYDFDLFETKSRYLERLIEHHLATLKNSVLQLTRKGRLLADKIAADLFVPHHQGEIN